MAGALRKTMVYLGLAEDDDRYDDDEHRDDVADYDERRRTPERSERPLAERSETGAAVTQLPRRPAPVARLVREPEVGPLNRITTIHPRTYNEAKTIGLQFRGGTPVIMNLSEMDDSDAKRLVDFAAGLTFGLHGSIERVTPKVFLLSPHNMTVTAADKQRIVEGGFYNQS
jgi:cell division inhibitor SepF